MGYCNNGWRDGARDFYEWRDKYGTDRALAIAGSYLYMQDNARRKNSDEDEFCKGVEEAALDYLKNVSVYELKERYYSTNPDGHYFDRETLKFFGEALSRMNVLKKIEYIYDIYGRGHYAYCLSSIRYVNGKRERHYAWFDAFTFQPIYD